MFDLLYCLWKVAEYSKKEEGVLPSFFVYELTFYKMFDIITFVSWADGRCVSVMGTERKVRASKEHGAS